jgi:RNA polymerase sigma-70 factor (ECF subfamily)
MSTQNQYDDMDLFNLVKLGDASAFSILYARFWHPMFLHCLKIIKDEDEAKDIVQDIFIQIWNNPEKIQITTSAKNYLYACVRNRVLNRIRQSKNSGNFLELLAREMSEADAITVDKINERELAELIDNEVNLLPPRMKQVFEMSRKEFLTHKQIALKLGTSEGTVKKQITNTLKILRGKLDRFGGLSILLLEYLKYQSGR